MENLFGGVLKKEIIASQGIVVVRPDSGNPVEMVIATAKMLKAKSGAVWNSKGFDVLNNTRIIYGDGINERSIRGILMELKGYGFSADNIAFGMGGALLQQVNRDTQMMAMKTSAILMPDGWRDVYKAPSERSWQGQQKWLAERLPQSGNRRDQNLAHRRSRHRVGRPHARGVAQRRIAGEGFFGGDSGAGGAALLTMRCAFILWYKPQRLKEVKHGNPSCHQKVGK